MKHWITATLLVTAMVSCVPAEVQQGQQQSKGELFMPINGRVKIKLDAGKINYYVLNMDSKEAGSLLYSRVQQDHKEAGAQACAKVPVCDSFIRSNVGSFGNYMYLLQGIHAIDPGLSIRILNATGQKSTVFSQKDGKFDFSNGKERLGVKMLVGIQEDPPREGPRSYRMELHHSNGARFPFTVTIDAPEQETPAVP